MSSEQVDCLERIEKQSKQLTPRNYLRLCDGYHTTGITMARVCRPSRIMLGSVVFGCSIILTLFFRDAYHLLTWDLEGGKKVASKNIDVLKSELAGHKISGRGMLLSPQQVYKPNTPSISTDYGRRRMPKTPVAIVDEWRRDG
ncbi:hypothetical protein HOLleu_30519 [Holothuria leucospilota]|uniref:Uncharacterized protein n=1 Tax=Holothuria leucospilota TaxID=206669 RepID=A0A9Q1BKI2_HOLLE|nr:hypothetical protein HOLleu_30519 [Holothuria leucospilota]